MACQGGHREQRTERAKRKKCAKRQANLRRCEHPSKTKRRQSCCRASVLSRSKRLRTEDTLELKHVLLSACLSESTKEAQHRRCNAKAHAVKRLSELAQEAQDRRQREAEAHSYHTSNAVSKAAHLHTVPTYSVTRREVCVPLNTLVYTSSLWLM